MSLTYKLTAENLNSYPLQSLFGWLRTLFQDQSGQDKIDFTRLHKFIKYAQTWPLQVEKTRGNKGQSRRTSLPQINLYGLLNCFDKLPFNDKLYR